MAGRQKGLNFYRKKKKISMAMVREVITWIFGICASVFVAFVVVYAVGMSTSVVGVSMEPALYNGQQVLINRYVYLLSSPKVNDVVVFLPNGNENSHYYIKRVVAVPGDTVQITDGRLYVNGTLTEDAFDKMADAGIAQNTLVLGNDEYFVLGDNRNNSEDSRSANIGTVKGKDIIGKVWLHLGTDTERIGLIK